MNNSENNFWFTIEPYVYIGLNQYAVLLFNTLDNQYIETDSTIILNLIKELLRRENNGVIMIKAKDFDHDEVRSFIHEVRQKYMGDIINTSLSSRKPVQILPLYNYDEGEVSDIYKRHNYPTDRNILNSVSEVVLYVDKTIDVQKLVQILKFFPHHITYSIRGNIGSVQNGSCLIDYLRTHYQVVNFYYPYETFFEYPLHKDSAISHYIEVYFPLLTERWGKIIQSVDSVESFTFIFYISSEKDCEMADSIIQTYELRNYQLKPVYDGNNLDFFHKYVFLTKEDILSSHHSIQSIFAKQFYNTYDFGKLHIVANGDAYANLHLPKLGNIYSDPLNMIVQNEVHHGNSWFRIRKQAPCKTCLYRWLCPSPSEYELLLGRENLCSVEHKHKR